MVLRDLRKPEYDTHKFPRQYVEFVKIPYRRPGFGANEPITLENAALAAAQCQGCEEPACVRDCPASIDIPGVLRRLEAGNVVGAARALHQRSPFGQLCGTVCPADQLCQGHCYRRSFAGQPVRIAELMNWVEEAAGVAGWLRPEARRSRSRMAVLGGNLAGITCAYYLALAGFDVDVLDEPASLQKALESVQRDLNSILDLGAHYHGGWNPARTAAGALLRTYAAVYCASDQWAENLGASSEQAGVFSAPASTADLTPAQLVAEGRRAAFAMYTSLSRAED
jgi:hypothetical protein